MSVFLLPLFHVSAKSQNQRQKARRPRSQSDTPLTRPPQYGPFPNAPGSAPTGFHADESDQGPGSWGPGPPTSGITNQKPDQLVFGGYPPSRAYLGSVESTSQLLGPGMPGQDLRAGISSRGRDLHMHSPELGPYTHSRSFTSRLYPHSRSPSNIYPLRTSRPTSAQTTSSMQNPDFSRTLPPLIFDSQIRGSFSAPGSRSFSHSMPTTTSPLAFNNSPLESPFAHHPPEQAVRPSLDIPPPFTLQPPPQWDTSASRPQRSSWSRPGSRSARESSPSDLHFPTQRDTSNPGLRDVERIPRLESTSHPRSGRYDPVRATVIPYPTPILPSARGLSDPEP
jgi:hypothetical protein